MEAGFAQEGAEGKAVQVCSHRERLGKAGLARIPGPIRLGRRKLKLAFVSVYAPAPFWYITESVVSYTLLFAADRILGAREITDNEFSREGRVSEERLKRVIQTNRFPNSVVHFL